MIFNPVIKAKDIFYKIGLTVYKALDELYSKFLWKSTTGVTGIGTIEIPEDATEIIIKVNLNSIDIVGTIYLPMVLIYETAQNYRWGYRQNSTNGGGAYFNVSKKSVSLTNAYLNAVANDGDVTSNTDWVVYYR